MAKVLTAVIPEGMEPLFAGLVGTLNQSINHKSTNVTSSATSVTLDAAHMAGGDQVTFDLYSSASGAITLTTDTAAAIIAALTDSVYKLRVVNHSTAQTITVAGGTSVTVSGTATVAPGFYRDFFVFKTSGSAVTLQSLFSEALDGAITISTVSGVSLSPGSLSLTAGGATGTLTATVSGVGNYDHSVTWSTSDGSKATVSGGVVTPVAAGSVTITATSVQGGVTGTATVTVAAQALSTKPKFGIRAAGPYSTNNEKLAILNALAEITASSAGSRASTFVLGNTAAGTYGWFASLASAGTAIFTSNSAPGFPGGWDGAGLAGDNTGGATSTLSVTDGDGNVWTLRRQDYANQTGDTWHTT